MTSTELSSPGDHVGPWQLQRRLGVGGMGEVWSVIRSGGAFSQRGALKRLHQNCHPGLGGDELVARFERERQVLASIEDPSVARLIDGGLDDAGRPYFVMEYVEGEALDAWCTSRRIPLRERVDLLARVARAVDVAHAQRVVHRDLKPSNILVDLEGRPHLIDFGIAKVLDPGQDTGLVTRDVARYLTPQFASPEQFAGKPPTTASDVYSLGALSYLVLTGQSPLDISGLSVVEAVQRVTEENPRPPSEVAASTAATSGSLAAELGMTPRQFRQMLAGDLDAVLLRCLRKEPARRYGRAGEVADDLERWLAGEPVLARRDTFAYRTRRFVQRHRAVVALTSCALALMAVGLAVTLYQHAQLKAQSIELTRRAANTERLSNDLLASIHGLTRSVYPELAAIPGTQPVLADVTRRLGDLASAQDDPRLVAEAIRSQFLYAMAAWTPFQVTRSRPSEVAETTHEARRLGLRLVGHQGVSLRAYNLTGEALMKSGWYLYYEGRLSEALEQTAVDEAWLAKRMRMTPEELVGKGRATAPGDRENPLERLALSWLNLRVARANVLVALGRLRAALDLYLDSIEEARRWEFRNPINSAILETDLERIFEGTRSVQVRLGVELLDESGRTRESSHGDRSGGLANQRIGEVRAEADLLLREGELNEARRVVAAELNRLGDSVDDDTPFDPPSQERGWVRFKLAEIELERGRVEEAYRHTRVAFDEIRRCVEGRPTTWTESMKLNSVRGQLGQVTALAGDAVEGARLLGVTLAEADRRLAEEERDWHTRMTAIDACCDLAGIQELDSERQRWLDRAAAYLEGDWTDAPDCHDVRERRFRITFLR